MDATLSSLRPLLRAALSGPHAWVYVVIAAGLLMVLLGFMVVSASREDEVASAALARRAEALRPQRPGPSATTPP